jgi:hypothetical protein
MDMNDTSTMNPVVSGAQRVRGISGSTLKLIAIFTMLIDHTAATILEKTLMARGMGLLNTTDTVALAQFYAENGLIYAIYMIMRLIGRIAFPIFCFLLVQGFLHTRNVTKYAIRLALFAAISEIPFDLAFNNKILEYSHQNVFFTLLIGLLTLISFQTLKQKVDNTQKGKPWLPVLAIVGALAIGGYVAFTMHSFVTAIANSVSEMGMISSTSGIGFSIVLAIVFTVIALIVYAVMCKKTSIQVASLRFADLLLLIIGMALADLLNTDYSGFGVLTVAVVYGLRKSYFRSMVGACITLTVMTTMEFTCFVNLIFIRFYNGTRGLNLKYIFYAFYPVHLFILYLICRAMNII